MRVQTYIYGETENGTKLGYYPYRIDFSNQYLRLVLLKFCHSQWGTRFDYKRWSDPVLLSRLYKENKEAIISETILTPEKLKELRENLEKDGGKVHKDYKRMKKVEKEIQDFNSQHDNKRRRVEQIKDKIQEWEDLRERQAEKILESIGFLQNTRFQETGIDSESLGRTVQKGTISSEHVERRIKSLEQRIYPDKKEEEEDEE